MKTLFGMTFAGLLAAGSLMAPAQAAPVLPQGHEYSPITRVEGGCGEGWHRGRDGYCYRNLYQPNYYNGRACPPGWHLGEEGRRCWRNY